MLSVSSTAASSMNSLKRGRTKTITFSSFFRLQLPHAFWWLFGVWTASRWLVTCLASGGCVAHLVTSQHSDQFGLYNYLLPIFLPTYQSFGHVTGSWSFCTFSPDQNHVQGYRCCGTEKKWICGWQDVKNGEITCESCNLLFLLVT